MDFPSQTSASPYGLFQSMQAGGPGDCAAGGAAVPVHHRGAGGQRPGGQPAGSQHQVRRPAQGSRCCKTKRRPATHHPVSAGHGTCYIMHCLLHRLVTQARACLPALHGGLSVANVSRGPACDVLHRRDDNGTLYYYLEFTVRSPALFRHNVSVYAARQAWEDCAGCSAGHMPRARVCVRLSPSDLLCICCRGGLLYTLNVQCPEDKWGQEQAMLRPIAESFNIL
jgi:PsbP